LPQNIRAQAKLPRCSGFALSSRVKGAVGSQGVVGVTREGLVRKGRYSSCTPLVNRQFWKDGDDDKFIYLSTE